MRKKIILHLILLTLFCTMPNILTCQTSENNTGIPTNTNRIDENSRKDPDLKENGNSMEKAQGVKGATLFDTVRMGGFLMIPIIIFGVIGLTLIIERIIFLVRSNAWKAEVLKDYLEKIMEKSNAKFREEMEDELQNAAQVYVNKLERGLALLNGLGNIAPIVGFLGTVLGMIEAFAAIASATTVNAKVVAVGIQIALVTTAGGLLVAAPILFFYHFFTHIVQNTYTQADEIISLNTMGFPRLSEGANSKEQIQA